MQSSSQQEREVRAARNQSLFRAINKKLETLNDAFDELTESSTISCECADVICVEMLEINPDEYRAVRAEPRHFVVLAGHVYPEVETVVRESDGYVVVEKIGAGGDMAEILSRDGTGEM
jgi:hypothetical protein